MSEKQTTTNSVVKISLDVALTKIEELKSQLKESTSTLAGMTKERNELLEVQNSKRRAELAFELKQRASVTDMEISKMSLDELEHDVAILKNRKPISKNINFTADSDPDANLTVGDLFRKNWKKE